MMKNNYEKIDNNIFDFATKELSQDALICWLINWINYKQNKELYEKSKELLNYILKAKGNNENIENYKVEIKQQYNFIDVFILLKDYDGNERFAIIIEDKKFTTVHDNQIEEYRKKIKKIYEKLNDNNIITVYYKPYEEIEEIVADVIIDRDYMLKNIFNAKINNQIYIDYKIFLESIEDTYQHFKEIPLREWSDKKEIFSMVAKEYNENQKKDEAKMKITHVRGSTFIDWYQKNNILNQYGKYFNKLYLSLNINYSKYELRIRGISKKCTKEIRQKLEEEISKECEEYGLKTSKFSHREIKENSNIFLAKIELDNNIIYNDLTSEIRKIEQVVDKITK